MRLGLQNASQNDNLDPGTWGTSWTGTSFNGGVYNNLVEIMPDGSVAGDLAESWEASDGAKVWHFRLRPGIRWSDGHPFTADDVAFSVQRAQTLPNSPGGYGTTLRAIESVEVVDALTLRVHTTRPHATLPNDLSYLALLPRHKTAVALFPL